MSASLLSKVQGCLLGVQIGDAMGMPWETMTPEEIAMATQGQGVQGFHDAVQTRFDSIGHYKAGQTTDDWQLTSVVATSLIQSGGYDQNDMARRHVEAYHRSTAGWGKTTKTGIASIAKYFESGGALGRNPKDWPESVPGAGTGNGVAMKISPLGLLLGGAIPFFGYHDLHQLVMLHCRLTHPDLRAGVGAFAVARTIAWMLDPTNRFYHTLQGRISNVTRFVDFIRFVEIEHGAMTGQIHDDNISNRLELFSAELLNDPVALREKLGTSCFVLESVPFSIATFLRHATDFRAGVLEAVNAGGDTDTNASMVGAMIGANVGLEGIPEEWVQFRPEFAESVGLGRQLYEVASSLSAVRR